MMGPAYKCGAGHDLFNPNFSSLFLEKIDQYGQVTIAVEKPTVDGGERVR